MYIQLMAAVFILCIISCAAVKNTDLLSKINIVGMAVLFAITVFIGIDIVGNDYISSLDNSVYIDSLGVIQLFLITSISTITAIYSRKYIQNEVKEGVISIKKAQIYYGLFQIFVLSMVFLSISNNIMAMWIGLEATTLSTAFLIGFNNNKFAIEAAWKYIIICSIGIGLGLVGIILFIYAADVNFSSDMLKWTYLVYGYKPVSLELVKIAFTLIFVGIGTKAGFAPMHTWLSDGHSEAPSPISAMMSGILINLAVYVIVRFYIVIRVIPGLANLRFMFMAFGMISLIIACFSILRQTNYKRLFAFSSVENMGIISLGIGFGGPIGVFGALLHSIIHAYGKSMLFLISGNILSAYKTKRIDKINGLIKTMPFNAFFLMLGILLITGAPPFAAFFSELNIILAGINSGFPFITFLYGICLVLALSGFLLAFTKMIFPNENIHYKRMDKDKENRLPIILTFCFIIFVSCSFNNLLYPILSRAVTIIIG